MTLRAWERRYGLVRPRRTDSGHRLYSQEDVERIHRIVQLLDQGVSVGQVAAILDAAPTIGTGRADPGEDATAWEALGDALLDAIARFDERELTRIYDEALGTYPLDLVNHRLIVPILERLGERWADRAGTVAEEHFFQVFVRNKLGARIHHHGRRREGPLVLAACMPGELHDLGLLFFVVHALDRGMRVVNLGANMPLEDLTGVLSRRRFAAVVLAANYSATPEAFRNGLPAVAREADCPVLVGGNQAARHRALVERAGAIFIGEEVQEGVGRLVLTIRA